MLKSLSFVFVLDAAVDVGTEVALMLSAHPLMAMVVGKGMQLV